MARIAYEICLFFCKNATRRLQKAKKYKTVKIGGKSYKQLI